MSTARHGSAVTSRRSAGMTLFELLVVMFIISTMVALGILGFQGMGQGAEMRAAVSDLQSTIQLARQWAITHNERTYVVFPDMAPALYSSPDEEHVTKALRSYNVYTASDGFVSQWKYLPRGILFVPNNSHYTDANDQTVFSDLRNVEWPEKDEAVENLPVLVFEPDGSLDGGSEVEIYIGEGALDAYPETGTFGSLFYVPEDESLLVGLEVTPFTGGVRVRDYRDLPL